MTKNMASGCCFGKCHGATLGLFISYEPILLAYVGAMALSRMTLRRMEQYTFKNLSNCWNTIITFYLETPGGLSLNLYLNIVYNVITVKLDIYGSFLA